MHCFIGTLLRFMIMVFNTTFNNISAISLRSVLLLEESEVLREHYRPAASHWQTLSHNVVKISLWAGIELTTLSVIDTGCTGSCKSNNHTIMTTTIPEHIWRNKYCPILTNRYIWIRQTFHLNGIILICSWDTNIWKLI